MSSASTRSIVPRPTFDPTRSLGWTDVALDGLSCYLRCVESILHWQGLDSRDVCATLVGPIDLCRRHRQGSVFNGAEIVWDNAVPDDHNWDVVLQHLAAGDPPIIMPDRFYWPGDEFEATEHFHDHMVVAFDANPHHLSVIDIDAPPDNDYIRQLSITQDLRQACTRIGALHKRESPGPVNVPALAALSARLLVDDVAAMEGLAQHWSESDLDYLTARGLHVAVLGDIQPTLFLFARGIELLEPDLLSILPHVDRATASAKRLGLLLLALHLQPNGYRSALKTFRQLIGSIDELRIALDRELVRMPGRPPFPRRLRLPHESHRSPTGASANPAIRRPRSSPQPASLQLGLSRGARGHRR